MKIYHVINQLAKGGAEKLLVEVLPIYVQMGYEVTLVELTTRVSNSDEPQYRQSLKEKGVNLISLSNGRLWNPLLIFKLASFFRSIEAGVVHVHLFPALYFASLASLLIKNKPTLIFTEHSTQNKRSNKFYFRPIEKLIYRRFDAVIAISAVVFKRLETIINDKQKIRLIRNGIEIGQFKDAKPISINELFENNGIAHMKVISMVARFMPPKDQLSIIKAMLMLPENYFVIFIGEGEKRPEAEESVKNNNLEHRVHFLGFRTDIPNIMKSVHLNILSSNYEGMSGVTLESLASGKPFIGSDVSGINDIVPDSSFLFEPGNPQKIAEKILEIVEDPVLTKVMVDKANHFVQQFDIRFMVEEHIGLYKKVVSETHAK